MTDQLTRFYQHPTADIGAASLATFQYCLHSLGRRLPKIKQWFEAGMENLREGRPAFTGDEPRNPDDPLHAGDVREALRCWRTHHPSQTS